MSNNKAFTVQEQEELNKASNALNLDADTKKLAFTYFLEYKQKVKQTVPERLPVMINCAIFCASKSQVITTVSGETIRGVGISITQLLRSLEMNNRPTTVDEFLIALKDFITQVTLAQDISTELKAIIDKFAFSYTFFIKFNNLIKQLDLELLGTEHEEYLRCVKNFGWILFLNARSSLLQNRTEFIESVFLLAATLTHIIFNLPKNIPLKYFQKKDIEIEDEPRDQEKIQEGILELLKLTKSSSEDVSSQLKALQEFVKKMIDNGTLRNGGTTGFEGLYEPQNLNTNIDKFDAYYQKKLGFDDLDERFYVRDRRNIQAGMFTPFAKQGAANKLSININITKNGDVSQSLQKNFPSQKMLNFEVSEQVSMKSNINDIRFAGNNGNKSIPASPFNSKIPPATPVTRALEMYNWLSDKVKLKKNPSGLTAGMEEYLGVFENKFRDEILTRANTLVDNVLKYESESTSAKVKTEQSEKKSKDKQAQMVNLYLKVLEELLNQESRRTQNPNYADILSNDEFHKALIACSIETVFFVNNSSNVSFPKLLELCEIQPFEFWRIINSFIKFDPQLPQPMRKHLHSLEIKILMNLAWKRDSAVHQIIKKFIAESENEIDTSATIQEEEDSPKSQDSQGSSPIQKSTSNRAPANKFSNSPQSEKTPKTELTHSQELFFKRVLHHTALQIFQLGERLQLKEKVIEQIWDVIKYVLSSETTLLINRHVDQLILSTVYGVCKILHEPYKFQEIITKYQELPFFDKNDFTENIHQVFINDGERADLIKFYNNIYIPQMKAYLFTLGPQPAGQIQVRPGTPQIKKPLVPALITQSPLREALPHPMMPAVPYRSVSAHAKSKTPIPSYGMTPRTGALYAFGESPSRTLQSINNIASKRQIDFDDGPDSNSGDFTMKKVKGGSSILDKIIEQRNEESEEAKDSHKLPASKKTLFSSDDAPSSSILNKFSFDSGDDKPSSLVGKIPFTQLLQSKSLLSAQKNVEGSDNSASSPKDNGSQQNGQSQGDSPVQKPAEVSSGFKKVIKKDGSITPEFTKK